MQFDSGTTAKPGPSAQPLYRQVKQHLINRILAGEWRPGQNLPSEIRLAEEYGLSQGTVRKAIEEMAVEGLVSRRAGRGTSVTSYSGTHRPFRFHRLMTEDGRKIASDNVTFVHIRQGVTHPRAATALGVPDDTLLTETLRIRDLDGVPALIEQIFLVEAQLPDISAHLEAARPPSIYKLLEEKYNLLITRVDERVRSRFVDPKEAELLKIGTQQPILENERTALSLSGELLEWRIMICETTHIFYSGGSD